MKESMMSTTQNQSLTKNESFGTVTFATEVIAAIAGIAAADVPGVADMSGGFIDGVAQLLGRKNYSKGIKVDLGQHEVAIEASIVAQYGIPIQKIAYEIQNRITTAIESMTGMNVTGVHVKVQALSMKPAQESEIAGSAQVPALSFV